MSLFSTSSPVSASTFRYRMRLPVFLLIWLKLILSDSEVAGKSAIGQVTSDSRKKPFQLARGAILKLHLILKNLNQYRWQRLDVESRISSPGSYRRLSAGPRQAHRCRLPGSIRGMGSARPLL